MPIIASCYTALKKVYCPKRFCRRRHKIENFFCGIKDWRRIATRYDKLARNSWPLPRSSLSSTGSNCESDLASTLWRLRRATGIETALFKSVIAKPDKLENGVPRLTLVVGVNLPEQNQFRLAAARQSDTAAKTSPIPI